MTMQTAIATVATLNNSAFRRVEEMSRDWLERVREFRQIESDFRTRLLTAKNTSEAMTTYNEWMFKRLAALASEQQIVAAAWFGLIAEAIKTVAVSRGQA